MNKTNNTYMKEGSSEFEVSSKANAVCFLDTELDEVLGNIAEDVDTDFSGALRLLSFSDKIIQPFEKKFIIDALSLGLSDYSNEQKLSLARGLLLAGKISRNLADMLLLDSESVVQKLLLKNYPYHTEDALVALANKADIEVLEVLAERSGLTQKTVTILLGRDIIEVSRLVLMNKRAECDSSILGMMIAKNVSDEQACLAMLNLPDMEPALALQLFWHAPLPARKIILKRFLKSHILVEGHFARMQSPNLRSLPLFSALSAENLKVDSVEQGFAQAIEYFKQGQFENGVRLISLCASLPLPLLQKIANDQTGEAMVVLLKALGLERNCVRQFLLDLTETGFAKHWSGMDCLKELYDMISWGEARMAVSYWLWQIEAIGPYQAAEERFLENISSTDFSEEVLREGACGE